jgi:ornithine carbamoyltransferase
VKHFLTLKDLTGKEIEGLVALGSDIKARPSDYRTALEERSLAMIFQKPSTRTRISFELAMVQMGGYALYLGWDQLQLGRGEPIEDTGRVLSRYVQCVMARVFRHEDLERLADSSSVPIINGLSDLYHPAQALSDLLTIREKLGNLQSVSIAYVGDGNNVCHSLLLASSQVGANIAVASPATHAPKEWVVEEAKRIAEKTGSRIMVVNEPEKAVSGADVVYTDVFVSMGMEEEREKRMKAFLPEFRVDEKLMEAAGDDSIFMHCLPAHRGEEVNGEVIDGRRSVVWDQAENRLHAQKALLYRLMRSRP